MRRIDPVLALLGLIHPSNEAPVRRRRVRTRWYRRTRLEAIYDRSRRSCTSRPELTEDLLRKVHVAADAQAAEQRQARATEKRWRTRCPRKRAVAA